jgi:tetratricopeptide (TPR) repeat protein
MPDGQRTADLLAEAGDMYLVLADLHTLDERRAAEALTLAGRNFDDAGMTERLVEVLTRYVDEHPTNEGRPAALFRLGRGYQALQQYDNAVAAFQEVIEQYPRLLSAHSSMVPLAECLISLGGEAAVRGADMLISIVDDTGPDHLFDPRAKEYRDALFRLAEYYVQSTEQEVPHHWEKAITRLEDAIALYPADPSLTRLSFLLADAYRLSATELRGLETASPDEHTRAAIREEVDRRFQRSLQTFEQVIAALAPQDLSALSNLEQTYLRAGYLYRADCLFDLGRYEAAIEAYNEAIWRYENLPTAVSASMQVLHCHQRLGQLDEARAALKRLSWLLRKIPADAFETERGMSSKQYWQKMVSRMESTGVF